MVNVLGTSVDIPKVSYVLKEEFLDTENSKFIMIAL